MLDEQRHPFKARIQRYQEWWLVRGSDSESRTIVFSTFRKACDHASYLTLMAYREAGLRQVTRETNDETLARK